MSWGKERLKSAMEVAGIHRFQARQIRSLFRDCFASDSQAPAINTTTDRVSPTLFRSVSGLICWQNEIVPLQNVD